MGLGPFNIHQVPGIYGHTDPEATILWEEESDSDFQFRCVWQPHYYSSTPHIELHKVQNRTFWRLAQYDGETMTREWENILVPERMIESLKDWYTIASVMVP